MPIALRRIDLALTLALLAACSRGDAPRDAEPPAPAPATADSAAPGDSTTQAMGIDSGPALPADSAVGALCPDPARPCPGFREHDLGFVLPHDETARAEVLSEPFFAVILRSAPSCAIPEADRAAAQALFPGRKAFLHRFGCDGDVENNVTYTGVNGSLAFLAVYAGRERTAADSTLATVRASGRFPGANLRRMQVKFIYP